MHNIDMNLFGVSSIKVGPVKHDKIHAGTPNEKAYTVKKVYIRSNDGQELIINCFD